MNIADILGLLDTLPEAEKIELLKKIRRLEKAQEIESAQTRFLPFVKKMWPQFISGRHHKIMADAFERVAEGKLKRLIINMPPRHTKSEFGSYLLPAWYLGRFPDRKVMQASNTAELAVGFGRKVRNLVDEEGYREVFPELSLVSDNKAAGRWGTNKKGEYFAIGVGGIMTGKGADLMIIDDPHSEQEAMIGEFDPAVYDKVYEWYTSGPRQRLQPGGAIVIIMTRWHQKDLTGQVLNKAIKDGNGDEWEVIEFPAIFTNEETGEQTSLWPEFWSLEELLAVKRDINKPSKWNAQYMQNPSSEEGALIKRDWWQMWERQKPPEVEAVLISMDTAFSKTERSDYSACTTWGLFMHDGPDGKRIPNLILLDAWKEKLEFPELKATVIEYHKRWNPDMFIVEKKASGIPLIAELRNAGVPVTEYTPTRATGDKIVRVNSVTDIFASRVIWAPDEPFAHDVVEECAMFPNGANDDYVDSVVMALLRYRQGGFDLPTDKWDEETDQTKALLSSEPWY